MSVANLCAWMASTATIDAADDPIACLLLESMEEAAALDADAEFNVYTLPSGTIRKGVMDSYIGEMKDTE